MPKHTIGLLEVVVFHARTGREVHPSNFGPYQKDLLLEWQEYLEQIGLSGGISHRERFLIVEHRSDRDSAREVECEIDYGRFGSRRRVRNSDNGKHISDIDLNEVPSDSLRTLLRSPLNGNFAFIAHETVGRSSCVGLLVPDFKRWFLDTNPGFYLEINYVEDADAWSDFLDGASLRELTFIARRSADGNRAGRPTKELYDVLPGRRGDVLPRRWLDRLISDGALPASEVLSITVSDDDIDETRVVVQKDGRRRTIYIGDDWPRFTWEVDPKSDARPGDELFYGVAREIIDGQLRRLRIDESNHESED